MAFQRSRASLCSRLIVQVAKNNFFTRVHKVTKNLQQGVVRRAMIVGFALAVFSLPCTAVSGLNGHPIEFHKNELSLLVNVIVPLSPKRLLFGGAIFDESGPSSWGWVAARGDGRAVQKELGKAVQSSALYAGTTISSNLVVLVGTANQSAGSDGRADGWIVAVKRDGKPIWEKSLSMGYRTHAIDVKAAGDDHLLVLGSVRDQGRDSVWTMRLDKLGNESGRRRLQGPQGLIPQGLEVFSNAEIIVYGKVYDQWGADYRAWVGSFTAEGALRWSHTVDAKSSFITSVTASPNGGGLVAAVDMGEGRSARVVNLDRTGKITSDGNLNKFELCGSSVVWTNRTGATVIAGVSCSSDVKEQVVSVVNLSGRPRQMQKLRFAVGGQITRLVPLPLVNGVGVIRFRQQDEITKSIVEVHEVK